MSDQAGAGVAQDKADTVPENAQDLTAFVQNMLEQMQQRFNQMSSSIIGRIDEMGNRIDDLEASIGELMQQAGIDIEEDKDGAAAGGAK